MHCLYCVHEFLQVAYQFPSQTVIPRRHNITPHCFFFLHGILYVIDANKYVLI